MRPIILVVACVAVFFVGEGLANNSAYRIATVKSIEQVEGFRLVTELAPEVAWLILVSTPSRRPGPLCALAVLQVAGHQELRACISWRPEAVLTPMAVNRW
ncbi:hypothetical protein EOA23_23485 [Mesorhizobium sp. M2A.F.Ca.ET.042.01.1.1]|uniref:hypothetical protein n=1 Tax=Mesorhizobium sp. M2A.F.Ca.ET.042.01.1.1 TaxID=2496745 RepID=UPI000FC9A875|nr:hypothetical protein [Mesorhizobium sp. M2A.F.Ca.ET.042.01.1.1]RUX23649.1 hypothetical protein EOA23_23485 [Mesorhizobium sp. M2A.F.Ca.ET.042.01.1.1]